MVQAWQWPGPTKTEHAGLSVRKHIPIWNYVNVHQCRAWSDWGIEPMIDCSGVCMPFCHGVSGTRVTGIIRTTGSDWQSSRGSTLWRLYHYSNYTPCQDHLSRVCPIASAILSYLDNYLSKHVPVLISFYWLTITFTDSLLSVWNWAYMVSTGN